MFSFIEKIKSYFKRNKPVVADNPINRIEIRARNDTIPIFSQTRDFFANIPQKIIVYRINSRTPIASGTNVYKSEVDVLNKNLGQGVTVRKQRKPGCCSQCRTPGMVVENTDGSNRWRCGKCGLTFN